MKNYYATPVLILALLFAFSSTVLAQNIATLDNRNGFRTASFGDSIGSFKNMRIIEDDGVDKFYERTDDDLSAGQAKLSTINYGFYKGRLYTVLVRTKGLSNSRTVLGILQSQYGSGSQLNEYIESYYWRGNKVVLTYDENSISGDGSVWYTSVPIQAIMDAEKNADNQSAGSKF